jgi:hypothetical protein
MPRGRIVDQRRSGLPPKIRQCDFLAIELRSVRCILEVRHLIRRIDDPEAPHRAMPRTSFKASVGLAAVIFTLAACGGSSATTGASTGAGAGGGTGASAPPVQASSSSGAPMTVAPAQAGGGAAVCTRIKAETIAALITVPVGQPFNVLSGSATTFGCSYGIGPNAGLTGEAIENAQSDTFIVGVIDAAGSGVDPYSQATGLGPMTPMSGIGDKAEYSYNSTIQEPPSVYVLLGSEFCSVSLNLSNASEVGLPASGVLGLVSPSKAAGLAQKEAALCVDALGS